MSQKLRVLFIQRYFRFYRTHLFKCLAALPDLELTMIYGTNPPLQLDVIGLNLGNPQALPFEVIPAHINCVRIGRRSEIYWFSKAVQHVRNRSYHVIISDFSLRLLSTEALLRIQRRRQDGFLFWDIGFPLEPNRLVMALRKRYYMISDGIILYDERERARLLQEGIPPEKLYVAQNTVDIEHITSVMQSITTKIKQRCYDQLGGSLGPILLHVGRLATFKRLDILLRVTARLKSKWPEIRLVLVGDGPDQECLVRQARILGLKTNVLFTGGITEAEELAPWFSIAKIVVAPAQIGLLAPQAHAYGRPLVTSNDLSISGPEAQILQPGLTGETYNYGDEDDLVRVLDNLLDHPESLEQYGRNGLRRAQETLGIDKQVGGFYHAITTVVAKRSKCDC